MDIENWVNAWDEQIRHWDTDAGGYYGSHPLSSCYSGKGASAARPDCLPEPYLGDPKGRHSVIFLNLNPGPPCEIFQGPTGLFTERVRKTGYRRWAQCLPYNPVTNRKEVEIVYGNRRHKGGEDFWRNRNRWIDGTTGYTHGENNPTPFCLELFPFHSETWGRLNLERCREWLHEWVLSPAADLANHAEIPAVICVGRPIERLFLDVLGLEPECRISSMDQKVPGNWPMKHVRQPVNRTFSKFRFGGGTFVVTWHSGGNKLPGPDFKDICRQIIFR